MFLEPQAVERKLRILIPEAQAIGSVACIRSLGRAGHTAIGMASRADAIGLRSRLCSEAIIIPERLSPAGFALWFEGVVRQRRIDLVIPSESLITHLGKSLPEFATVLPGGPNPQSLAIFMQKFELFRFFSSASDATLRRNLPRFLLVGADAPWHESVARLECPLFAKFDAVPAKALAARVERCDSPGAAKDTIGRLLPQYGRATVQQYADGIGVGVFFLRWNGQIRASLMHRRLHEVPHSGGVSSLRETWWDDDVYADAKRRIDAMDWWGVGMFEYRWNPKTRQFCLLEFNARFWGSLHLALFAGVDFPKLLVDSWVGKSFESRRAKPGVRCRLTFPKEIEYLWSVVSDPSIGWLQKAAACAEFVTLSLNPRVSSDLWFPGDRALYLRSILDTGRRLWGAR